FSMQIESLEGDTRRCCMLYPAGGDLVHPVLSAKTRKRNDGATAAISCAARGVYRFLYRFLYRIRPPVSLAATLATRFNENKRPGQPCWSGRRRRERKPGHATPSR